MQVLLEISASDPTTILGAMVAAISAMALYIQRTSESRVAREREIANDYKAGRDEAVKKLADLAEKRDDTVVETMREIIKATAEVQQNVTLMARHVIGPRAGGSNPPQLSLQGENET